MRLGRDTKSVRFSPRSGRLRIFGRKSDFPCCGWPKQLAPGSARTVTRRQAPNTSHEKPEARVPSPRAEPGPGDCHDASNHWLSGPPGPRPATDRVSEAAGPRHARVTDDNKWETCQSSGNPTPLTTFKFNFRGIHGLNLVWITF